MLQSSSLKKKKGGGEVYVKKETKNTEPAFKITSMVSIKYVNQLVMAHCDLAMIKKKLSLKGLTVNRKKYEETYSFKKKIIITYLKFSGLTKAEEQKHPHYITYYLHKTLLLNQK